MLTRIFAGAAAATAGCLAWAHWPTAPLPEGTRADRIVVAKRDRTLTLYQGSTFVRQYSVSLGRAPVGAKEREGDKKTPEGIYRIIEHKRDSSYYRALRVSYPEPHDVERARKRGHSPGSDIMVHGLPNGLGVIGRTHRWLDWTAGCIAVTNAEMHQLFHGVIPGATIEIRE